jgi:hypothetical protein
VVSCEDGELIGAHFVGRVAVGCDSIGAGDNMRDLAARHHGSRSRVRDHRVRDTGALQLPRSKSRSLEKRPCLADEDKLDDPARERGPEGPEGSPVASGRESTRVAVSESSCAWLEQRSRVLSHSKTALDLLTMKGPRVRARIALLPANLRERPGKVDRRWTRREEHSHRFVEILPVRRGQGVAVGSSDADRRRAAHSQGANRLGDLGGRTALELNLLVGEPALVEEDDSVVLEAQDLVGFEVSGSGRRRG